MPERDSGFRIDPVAVGVGPAMSELPGPAHERRQRRCRSVAIRAPKTRYAAHGWSRPGATLRVFAGRQGRAMREIPEVGLSNPLAGSRGSEAERDPDEHVVRVDGST